VSRTLWLAAVMAALVAAGLAVVRFASAVPRLGAMVEVLTLLLIWMMPPLLLTTAAAAAGTTGTVPVLEVAGVCLLTRGPVGLAQLALYALALAAVAGTAAAAARALGAAHRAELSGRALSGAVAVEVPGGHTAWVIPSPEPVAYCGGLRHTRPVVTTGLLGLLEPAEQEAVLRHEVAHHRLGHPRLLVLSAAIGGCYRWLPPARLAWSALRGDLEAAADDEAAVNGAGPLLSAVAKVALAQAGQPATTVPAAAGFADPVALRYRIRRLQQPRPRQARTVLALGAVGTGLVASLALGACLLLHAEPGWNTLLPCLAAFGYLGWRPAWARRGRREPAPGSAAGARRGFSR
jgi:Zn-dependent protease with chaperone function